MAKAHEHAGWYSARFNTFGNFELIADNEAPTISSNFRENANLSHAGNIVITPKDNNQEIKNFRAELDGKWLLFSNDKGRSFVYDFDEKCQSGNHELTISVEDEAGNQTVKTFHFTREKKSK